MQLETLSKALQDQRKPSVGSRFTSRRTGKTVDVVRVEDRDGVWAVAIQESSYASGALPNSPVILWANDFLAEYIPLGESTLKGSEPAPVVNLKVQVAVGEEWFSVEHNEYVTVENVDFRRMQTAVRGASTGKLRNIHLDDFANEAKCRRVVRTTVHQRLMGDDDY